MLFSIIINTHNQYDVIERCIDSCINQEFNEDYEIIISDTSDIKTIKKYSKEKTLIKVVNKDSFSSFPCVDQMLSIKNALQYASGKIVCLLDGDDFFHPSKLRFLQKNFVPTSLFLNQDNLVGFNEKKQQNFLIDNQKKYKNNKLFNKLFNSWPRILGTSSITTNKTTLNEFFLKVDPTKWNCLAIDAMLTIYFDKIKAIEFRGDNLTYKSFHDLNLDSTYSNKFSQNYWTRRDQQHNYYQFVHKKKYTNIDTLLSRLLSN